MSQEEKIRKGCGKLYIFDLSGHTVKCGMLKSGDICQECKAQLKGIQIGKAEAKQDEIKFLEEFDYKLNGDEEITNPDIIERLQELKTK